MAVNLTKKQQDWWVRLEQIKQELKVTGRSDMHRAMRQLAIEVLRSLPDGEAILLNDRYVALFGRGYDYSSKAALIQNQRSGGWAEYYAMIPALVALGYQVNVHTDGYTEPQGVPGTSGLEINLKGDRRNIHWQLQREAVPGDGNCGHHAMAFQAVDDGLKEGLLTSRWAEPVVRPRPEPRRASRIQQKPKSDGFQDYHYRQADDFSVERDGYIQVKSALEVHNVSTEQLLTLYSDLVAYHREQGTLDRWLEGQPEDRGLGEVIAKGRFDATAEPLVRENLVHILGAEAWRDKASLKFLQQKVMQLTSSEGLDARGMFGGKHAPFGAAHRRVLAASS